jgi:hypothetical protein
MATRSPSKLQHTTATAGFDVPGLNIPYTFFSAVTE